MTSRNRRTWASLNLWVNIVSAMSLHPRSSRPLIDSKIRRTMPLLYRWYQQHQRPLPWRTSPTPYHIAVSEFMCQQTRITTVLPYYRRWLRRFPSWSALARAPQSVVLRLWEGLGYYRRARSLHALAKSVLQLPHRRLPSDPQKLLQLPGIGHYTAGAIASIAFNVPTPAFDGNVARVLGRLLARGGCSPSLFELRAVAAALVPRKNPGTHNQALMELGALLCLPKNPLCPSCPLRSACPSRLRLPQRANPRPPPTPLREHILVIRKKQSIWLTRQHPSNRWRGLHLLPTTPQPHPEARHIGRITYPFTRYKITASIDLLSRPPSGWRGKWHTPSQLSQATLPAPHRKALALLNQLGNLQNHHEGGSLPSRHQHVLACR
ncbi:MAG: A/G-specific adenine glycosylase [Proteobacteria bacterium]|nr:A/G-specific adenine glycosylase [Pseudomonadota bacterium]